MAHNKNPAEKLRPLGHRGLALPKQETVNRALGLNKPKPKPDPARQAFVDLVFGDTLRSLCYPSNRPEDRARDDFEKLPYLPHIEEVEEWLDHLERGIWSKKPKKR